MQSVTVMLVCAAAAVRVGDRTDREPQRRSVRTKVPSHVLRSFPNPCFVRADARAIRGVEPDGHQGISPKALGPIRGCGEGIAFYVEIRRSVRPGTFQNWREMRGDPHSKRMECEISA